MKNLRYADVNPAERSSSGALYRLLRIFTVIHPGEAQTAFLLTVSVFLLLTSYYIIKPVREALILAGKGAEIKSYLAGAQAILLILVVKAFSSLASRFPRHILVTWVTLFFISNLALFYVFSLMSLPLGTIGIIFFIWVGIFNVMVVAQFWAFANDIYSHEEGKRLFPIVAFGANVGAFSGSKIAGWLVEPVGLYQMMLVAGGILGIYVLLVWVAHKRETEYRKEKLIQKTSERELPREDKEKPLEKGGGFELVFKSRYLIFIALLILLLNLVNTTGEYILSKTFLRTAENAIRTGAASLMDKGEFIGKMYADFNFIMTLLTIFIQLFLVSRIFKWMGVRGALFFLPLISLGGYLFIALGASLLIVRWAKILENSTDYSLMNTTRHALFLITSREAKYKAKAAIDTFVWRAGDVFSALLVFLGTTYFAFNVEKFATFNVAIAVFWILLCFFIAREHKKMSEGIGKPSVNP